MKATLEMLPSVSDVVKEVRVTDSRVDLAIVVDGRTMESSIGGRSSHALLYTVLVLEIAAVHAQHHARVEPTFLLIDELLDFFHPKFQVAALERIERAAEYAQVAIISHSLTVVAECGKNWKLTTLEGSPGRHDRNLLRAVDLDVRTTNLPHPP